MIDWAGLVANSLWIVGCALALGLVSYASWQASLGNRKFISQFKQPQLQAGFSLAGMLFSAGLALTSNMIWEKGLWAAVGVFFGLRLFGNARSSFQPGAFEAGRDDG